MNTTLSAKISKHVQRIVETKFQQVFPHTECYIELQDELIEELTDAIYQHT